MKIRRARIDATSATDTSFPDTVLPDQYFDRIRARASDMPEKRLMVAVLFDSIAHLQRRGSVGSAEAQLWIRGEGDAEEAPFSFKNICEALGIDATYLARGLFRWHQTSAGSGAGPRLPFRHPRISRLRIRHPRRRRRASSGAALPA
jgi:hypothetical protein